MKYQRLTRLLIAGLTPFILECDYLDNKLSPSSNTEIQCSELQEQPKYRFLGHDSSEVFVGIPKSVAMTQREEKEFCDLSALFDYDGKNILTESTAKCKHIRGFYNIINANIGKEILIGIYDPKKTEDKPVPLYGVMTENFFKFLPLYEKMETSKTQ